MVTQIRITVTIFTRPFLALSGLDPRVSASGLARCFAHVAPTGVLSPRVGVFLQLGGRYATRANVGERLDALPSLASAITFFHADALK